MKNFFQEKKKYIKRTLSITMMLVLLFGQGNVYAALKDGEGEGTGSNANFGDLFTACEISEYRSGDVYTYPEKEGYVFAGWYTNATYETAISQDVKSGKYFPKFVDESVLSLRLQLTKDTTSTSEKTTLRLITSVDNLKYASVGFLVGEETCVSNTVYQTITGYTKDAMNSYVPNEVFHSSSNFFATCTLENAINEVDNHGTGDLFGATVNVVPQWTTLDGTTVTGEGANFEINDFLYESELQADSRLWGTLLDNLGVASESTEDATINLLKDVTVDTTSNTTSIHAEENVTVTVNGNGKTVTTSGEQEIFSVDSSEGNIEWNDINIQHNGKASLFELNGSCSFTLSQVSIIGTATDTATESAIIRTGDHCTSAHLNETIEEGRRTFNWSQTTETFFVAAESCIQDEQDKTVTIRIHDSSINTTDAAGMAGIRVMRGTIAHIMIDDSNIDTNNVLPVYVTGSDATYPTWRGMAYITVDSTSAFSQAGNSLTTTDMKTNNAGMVALQEYTNRVIIMSDPHYMPEEDEEGSYKYDDEMQGLSLGHTQADRMKNILLDIEFFNNRQSVDSVLVLGDLSTDEYPKNKIGINDDGTFSDISLNYVSKFKNEVMLQFQNKLGITSSWALPGNHDSYTNDQWNQIMGYDRQYTTEIGNAVFVMLDNYVPINNTAQADYSGIDIDWLKTQLNNNPSWIGKPIFLCCHYYQYSESSSKYDADNTTQFQALLAEYEAKGYQFVSMFMGHVHSTGNSAQYYIDSTSETPKIPMLMLSGYAFNTLDNNYDYFRPSMAWGFGVLEWNDNEAHYYHVKYDRTYVSTADDGTTDTKVSYQGNIENEIFINY